MKIGDKVSTPHGFGIIKEREKYSRIGLDRFGVELENNPFSFPVAYYFDYEIKKVENDN